MNKLKLERKKMVLDLLIEGNSLRGTQRITGVHRETIIRLVREVGEQCSKLMDKYMRDIRSRAFQVDEIWTYVHCKKERLPKNERDGDWGDQYVFVAIDADTKLVPCFLVGKRNEDNARNFIDELQERVVGRFQLTTDAFAGYDRIDSIGFRRRVAYAKIIKIFKSNGYDKREGYRPSDYVRLDKRKICGNPVKAEISTSYVERQNLTMRTQMRRFTCLTNAFSKKLDCLKAACAIHFWYYNFMRVHQTLRCTPAMKAGIASTFATWDEVLQN